MRQNFKSDESIIHLLLAKMNIEKAIEDILTAKGFPHFSSKKFVGNLGEYYAKLNLVNLFQQNTLEISKKSNDDCDLKGKLIPEIADQWAVPIDVNIEVKTRYNQKGNPHLRNIHKDKFHLLVYVALNKDYSCNFVGVLRKEDIIETADFVKYKRIHFSHYKDKLLYPDKSIVFQEF